MLKLYDVQWHTQRGQPTAVTWPPGKNVIWVKSTLNDNARSAEEYHTCNSTGFIAASDITNLLEIIQREFPYAKVTSIAEFSGIPYMDPDAAQYNWAIARFNYFANCGELLPETAFGQNVMGLPFNDGTVAWQATTRFAPPPAPLHHHVESGIKYPYDDRELPVTTERSIVLGILHDLSDRRGIKWELEKVDGDIRIELVDELTAVVKSMLNK